MRRPVHRVGAAQLAVVVVAVAVGIESINIARNFPGYSFAGATSRAEALELTAGGALVLAGVVAMGHPARRTFGAIFTAAGLSWFVLEWNNPGVGSAVVFTVGIVLNSVCPALVAHAVLRYPDRRLDVAESVALGLLYISTLLLGGLVPALAFDPGRTGCSECPTNLVHVTNASAFGDESARVARCAEILLTVVLVLLVLRRLVSSSRPWRRVVAPVLLPASLYFALVGESAVHSVYGGLPRYDTVDRQLWTGQCICLILLGLGTGWAFVQVWVIRATVARLVVNAAEVQASRGLDRALGSALGDDGLQVMYPLSDGRLADRFGQPAEPGSDQAITALTRGTATVAVLAHRPGVLDAPGVADDIAAIARIALDSERLRAERRAQLADLRASRSRLVTAADTERRRLERDLHDGAQQHLVTLLLSLRLARLRLANDAPQPTTSCLDAAQAEVTTALAELRDVARGLYPRELADEGLTAGLEALVASASIPVWLTCAVDERCSPSIESAAYFAVDYCIRRSPGTQASVSAHRANGVLSLAIDVETTVPDLVDVEDRVGALGGTVHCDVAPAGGAGIRVELPCGW